MDTQNNKPATMFPYQIEGARWLTTRKYALLADEMGLGKSVQAIKAMEAINPPSVLIVCPAIARINWQREIQKWSSKLPPFQIIADGKTPVQGKHWIISYDLLAKRTQDFPREIGLMIADESHFLKTATTKRTRAIFGIKGPIYDAARVWCLSGTPAPNHPAELWPILYTFRLMPLQHDAFVDRYCTFYRYLNRKVITGANQKYLHELKALLKIFMLRRKIYDVLTELPPFFCSNVTVEPGHVDLELFTTFLEYVTPDDRRAELYEKLQKQRELLKLGLQATNVSNDHVKTLEAFAQSVSTLRRFTAAQKIQPVTELVADELTRNVYEKIVIFAITRDFIEYTRQALQQFGAVTLYGGTDPSSRQRHIDRFQKNPQCRVIICNIQAAGTAITLTAANHIIFGEASWNPGENAQAIGRCRRIGQTKPVFVRFIEVNDSVDQKVMKVLRRKTQFLLDLFDGQIKENNELIGFEQDILKAHADALLK